MPGLRGAQVTGLLDGTDAAPPTTVEQQKSDKTMEVVPNPLYAPWLSKDQQVLSYLMNSLSKEVLAQFVGKENTYDLWTGITTLFASQSQSPHHQLEDRHHHDKEGQHVQHGVHLQDEESRG